MFFFLLGIASLGGLGALWMGDVRTKCFAPAPPALWAAGFYGGALLPTSVAIPAALVLELLAAGVGIWLFQHARLERMTRVSQH